MMKKTAKLLSLFLMIAATGCAANIVQESVAVEADAVSVLVDEEIEEIETKPKTAPATEEAAVAPEVQAASPTEFPAPTEPEAAAVLPVLGPAPAWENEVWINTGEIPLPLQDLRGKVVLLEFWTFGCINCRRVVPYVKDWHEKYAGDDFTVISIHYPEFGYEEVYDNVVQASQELGVAYPIALDNDGATWRAYHQRYWPTTYLIDKEGNLRYKHIGEGAYEETEYYIQALMAEVDPAGSG